MNINVGNVYYYKEKIREFDNFFIVQYYLNSKDMDKDIKPIPFILPLLVSLLNFEWCDGNTAVRLPLDKNYEIKCFDIYSMYLRNIKENSVNHLEFKYIHQVQNLISSFIVT